MSKRSKPTTDLSFNPSYATVERIVLLNELQEPILDITKPNGECKYTENDQCQYERLELSESITEIFPSGALIVRNIKDITTFISDNSITKIKLVYIDGSNTIFDITSVGYITNAASANEENYVAIHFTNLLYKYSQSHSLNQELIKLNADWKMPQVFRIYEFVQYVNDQILTPFLGKNPVSWINNTNNYLVYKTLNPKEYRIESPTDSVFQYLKYLSNFATSNHDLVKTNIPNTAIGTSSSGSSDSSGSGVGSAGGIFGGTNPGTGVDWGSFQSLVPNSTVTENAGSQEVFPRFMFWTDFYNRLNFKYFPHDVENDPGSSDEIITRNYLRFGVFNGELTVQELSDGQVYRKISFVRTDPSDQFVSKNYHYIRKTPKVMDTDPANTTGDYYSKTLSYQFLDEGEKYNIELFSSIRMDGSTTAPNPYGMTGATAGSDELIYTGHWGYFNQLDPVNDGKSLTLLGQDFGTKKNFADLYYMGNVGYFPYVDNPDMWKNMFDLTEVHPHEPDHKSLALYGIPGYQTNLQKILTIRYKSFLNHIQSSSSSDRLTLMRQIEKQNFIMYVLCCMAKQEQSFFALLTRYEKDNSLSLTDNYPYRYKWVKVNFNSAYNSNGPTTTNPPRAGGTYYIHQVEKWEKDGIWKSSETQDDTWAINLNERMAGLTAYNGTYFAPGWIKPSGNFKWRPVGAQGSSISTSGDIVHLVKMNMIPYTDLLLDSQNTVDKTQMGKYLYYFTVENVVDGSC